MRIVSLAYEGVKGQRKTLTFDKRCFAAIGPMGCGKSAALDALHLALNLPTPFGSTGLERLSPTGIWNVRLEVAGDAGPTEVQMLLEREMKRGRAGWRVNGIQVDRAEYEKSVAMVLEVEPHHVRLNEFLSLSGQKRAALFAGMLESPAVPLSQYLGVMPDELMGCLGADMLPRLRAIRGTPAVVTDAVKALANEMNQRSRDSKARLEGLERKAAGVSHGRSVAQVQGEIQRIDTELGAVAERRKDAELQKSRYDAAKNVLSQAVQEEDRAGTALEKAKRSAGTLPELEAAIAAARKAIETAKEDESKYLAEEKEADKQAREAAAEWTALDNSVEMLGRIHNQPWNIDVAWLAARMEEAWVGMSKVFSHDGAVKFARDVVTQAFGGEVATLKAKSEAASRREDVFDSKAAAARKAVSEALSRLRTATQDENLAITKVAAANEAKDRIPACEADVVKAKAHREAMEREANTLHVGQDVRTIEGDETRLRQERKALATQLTELQEANAISGQVEEARLEVKKAELALGWFQELTDRVQRARDESVRTAMQAMWQPFRETFAAIFGQSIELAHESSGVGRSTEFTFSVPIKGRLVPLDMLSDGETALTAMAFLAALQKVKKGPGSILTLNAEALDAGGMALLLAGAPKLGMDFVMLTNNRLTSADIPAEWCFAAMDK